MRNNPGQAEGRTGIVTGGSEGKVKSRSKAGSEQLQVAHYACFGRLHEKLAGRNDTVQGLVTFHCKPRRGVTFGQAQRRAQGGCNETGTDPRESTAAIPAGYAPTAISA